MAGRVKRGKASDHFAHIVIDSQQARLMLCQKALNQAPWKDRHPSIGD